MPRRRYLLPTQHPPQEVLQRVAERLKRERGRGWFHSFWGVHGRISEQSFTLTIPNSWWHSRAPYWRLHGSPRPVSGGSEVEMILSIHPVFLLLTTVMPALLFFPMVVLGVPGGHLAALGLWAVVVALFTAIFRLFPLLEGLFTRNTEDQRLLRFAREALDLEPVTAA
jgi:hypothetical protein